MYPASAHDLPVALQPLQAATQVRDAVARQAAVGLDLRLAGAPGADPATEPLEVGPQAPHSREVVLELGQLHLELALGAVGVVGEDVEDHGRPVDHRHAQTLLEVALLARDELVVAHDEVRVRAGDLGLDLGELPAAEIAVGIRPGANLDDLADVRDSGGAQELLELREGIAVAGRGGQDAHAQRALTGPRVLDPAGAVRALGPQVAGSFHWFQCRRVPGGIAGTRGNGADIGLAR